MDNGIHQDIAQILGICPPPPDSATVAASFMVKMVDYPPMVITGNYGGKTLLTMHADGRLEFGPDAYPEEAVKVLVDFWHQYVPVCKCGAKHAKPETT